MNRLVLLGSVVLALAVAGCGGRGLLEGLREEQHAAYAREIGVSPELVTGRYTEPHGATGKREADERRKAELDAELKAGPTEWEKQRAEDSRKRAAHEADLKAELQAYLRADAEAEAERIIKWQADERRWADQQRRWAEENAKSAEKWAKSMEMAQKDVERAVAEADAKSKEFHHDLDELRAKQRRIDDERARERQRILRDPALSRSVRNAIETGRLLIGMTEAQVMAAWGLPERIDTSAGRGAVVWIYCVRSAPDRLCGHMPGLTFAYGVLRRVDGD